MVLFYLWGHFLLLLFGQLCLPAFFWHQPLCQLCGHWFGPRNQVVWCICSFHNLTKTTLLRTLSSQHINRLYDMTSLPARWPGWREPCPAVELQALPPSHPHPSKRANVRQKQGRKKQVLTLTDMVTVGSLVSGLITLLIVTIGWSDLGAGGGVGLQALTQSQFQICILL